MATSDATTGMAHLTVVPENFERVDEDATGASGDGVVDADDGSADPSSGPSEQADGPPAGQ
ncbi:MAG: hypothetical protein ABEJ26_08010 [Halosimplex sp.]